jgi:hypothetical protein
MEELEGSTAALGHWQVVDSSLKKVKSPQLEVAANHKPLYSATIFSDKMAPIRTLELVSLRLDKQLFFIFRFAKYQVSNLV